MKHHIVSDGAERLQRSKEFQARLRELRQTIRDRHAVEFTQAGFFRRMDLRWQMAVKFRRERRTLLPSPYSLYSSMTRSVLEL
jgi:hypothetical protein